ncbi:MAG: hypothetical protein E3J69_07385, partial [Anaerolineales bacterium]
MADRRFRTGQYGAKFKADKFWEDPEFESWAADELIKPPGRSDRLALYAPKYSPPPPARDADSLAVLREEAAYSPAMMAPYSPADPRLLEALRTPETERLYSPAPAAPTERELSFQEYMSARSTKPDQRANPYRLVPYDFGIGDIFKIQMDWQIENLAIINTIRQGEVSPFIGAGRLLNSWWKHGKQLWITPEGQDERVWIDVKDPETGQTTVVPADIRKRPPLGRLFSAQWMWTKGKAGALLQTQPGLDVIPHGIHALIDTARLGFNLTPYGAIARLVGAVVRNPFAPPDTEREPANFWDYFPVSMYWNEDFLENAGEAIDAWDAGAEFMRDYFEKNPPFPTANNSFVIQAPRVIDVPSQFVPEDIVIPGINVDMLPGNLQKPYNEMTKEEKAEFTDYTFAAQRIISLPEYRYYFDKLKEFNPDWDSARLRTEAARMAWPIGDAEELKPLHGDVAEGFGDIMGASYYYALATGAMFDLEKHPWFNQEAYAADAWEKAVKEYAQQGNQGFIQGMKTIGRVFVEVDPDYSFTFSFDKEAQAEFLEQRDSLSAQLGRDLGYWETYRVKERYEDPVIEMIGEGLLDIGNLSMFNKIWGAFFGGAWWVLRKTGIGALNMSKKIPLLGNSVRWLTRETTVSMSRGMGFKASEFFATIMQSARDNRAFVHLVDEFGLARGVPVTVRSRQLRYADELAQLARPEEWARMADNAVERAARNARRAAMGNGITDPRVLNRITAEPRLVVEELASAFEAIFIKKAQEKLGDRMVARGPEV